MTKLEDYKSLQEECAVILGQMAETSAKARLLRTRLANHPELVSEISDQMEKLEIEMIAHFESIRILDEKIV